MRPAKNQQKMTKCRACEQRKRGLKGERKSYTVRGKHVYRHMWQAPVCFGVCSPSKIYRSADFSRPFHGSQYLYTSNPANFEYDGDGSHTPLLPSVRSRRVRGLLWSE